MDRTQFEQMDQSKLLDKITELNKKLFKMSPGSAIYPQLRAIIGEAQQVYQESIAVQMYNAQNEEKDDVLNIVEIESVVYTPDYGDNTILDTVVQQYTGGK